ncbi:hypothetical protein ACFVT6_19760 [Streptomyces sp. NPDC058049]|uniref:hypothetical protein n=1 Tax=Streptomyces sp. NPDC058049 TaxID=3346314 RepID=UPI0036EC1C84
MTSVFSSDSADKARGEVTASEAGGVAAVRATLHCGPRDGERPGYDPAAEDYVVRLDEQVTRGQGITVRCRYHPGMDAVLITWFLSGP